MAVIKTILVRGTDEHLRVVQVPGWHLQLDLDVDPETVLEGARDHFRNQWRARVHALRWLFAEDLSPPASQQDPFLVLWVDALGELPESEVAVHGILDLATKPQGDSLFTFLALAEQSFRCAPWQLPSWLPNIADWVRAHFAEPHYLSQVRTSPNCAVLRIRGGDETYFLKCLPKPLAYESALLTLLNRRIPGACPHIISISPDPNTHVTEGIVGPALHAVEDPQAWQAALADVARVQIECVALVKELSSAGVPHHYISKLATDVGDVLHDLVVLQTGLVNQLAREDINQLFATLSDITRDFDILQNCDLPETLVHGDLNQSNVFKTSVGGTMLIDWTLSRITHPFFVLASAVFAPYGALSQKPPIYQELCNVYLEPWSDFQQPNRLRTALEAACRLFWIDSTMMVRSLCKDKHLDNRFYLPRFLRAILKAYKSRSQDPG